MPFQENNRLFTEPPDGKLTAIKHDSAAISRHLLSNLLVFASFLAIVGISLSWQVLICYAQDPAASGQYRRFTLSRTTAANAEAFLRTNLPANAGLRSFTNPELPQELVLVGDAPTLRECEQLLRQLETLGPTAEASAGDRPSTSPSRGSLPPASPAINPPPSSALSERALATVANPPNRSQERPKFAGDRPLNSDFNSLPSDSNRSPIPPARETLAIDNRSANNVAPDITWHQISLRHLSLEKLQESMNSLLASRLAERSRPQGMIYQVATGLEAPLQFGWDWQTPSVNISGPELWVRQLSSLIEQLDADPRVADVPRVIAYRNASTDHVQEVLTAYRGDTSAPGANAPVTIAGEWRQDPVPQLPGNQLNPDAANPPQEANDDTLKQLKDSVQVETLPDLGIILLRGRTKDVQELSRIIQELERLSAESQPEVHIVNLNFARSDSVQKILQTTSPDLISGRSGRVSVTSLGKPNALLLIGWGESLTAVTELIQKLDQPVGPESQFEVFRLERADAAALQTSLNSFFQNRDGLGTKVQVVTDTRSNSVVVFGAPRDLAEIRRFIAEMDVPSYQRRQQARVVPVRNALAAELATTLEQAIQAAQGTRAGQAAFLELLSDSETGRQVLESGVLEEVRITPNPLNNTLVLSGPAESMDLLEALVRQLDVGGATAQIKIFRIEHGDASTLVQMLRSLMPEQSLDRPPLKLANNPTEPSLAPLRFSVDSRTNSIIATGSESDLRIIHALLLRLDEKEFSERRNMVYRLKNAPATDVAQAINNFLRSERQVQQAGSTSVSPFEQLEREVIVVPEPIGNRLILSATPRFFSEIEMLINQLDEPPPQVMIQVMIAEITLENSHEFGLELGLQDSILFDRSLLGNLVTTTATTQTSTPAGVVTTTEQVIQAASNQPGFDFNNQPLGNSGSNLSLSRANLVGSQGISNFAVGRVNNELGFGGLVLSASSESISALLRALQESKRLEILSRPQIRTLDNQPAFIQVGQRVPRIIGSTVNQAGQSNSIALENVGLILGVTPRISPDGTVVMEIDAERSGLGPENEGIPVSVAPNGNIIRSPRVDTTTAQATVSAASGETILLGGLITKRTTTIDRRVPWLSQIPLLGNLFRYDLDNTQRAELLIVLTPYVIRDRLDEQRLQQMEFARMNWCLCDIEEIHGSLDNAYNPALLDYPAWETQEIYPGQSPVMNPSTSSTAPLAPSGTPPTNSQPIQSAEPPPWPTGNELRDFRDLPAPGTTREFSRER